VAVVVVAKVARGLARELVTLVDKKEKKKDDVLFDDDDSAYF